MTSSEDRGIRYVEERVPLDGIAETAEEVITAYGGEITAQSDEGRTFSLPRRRGVAASGAVQCELTWEHDDEGIGIVTLTSGEEVAAPRPQAIALLVVGVIGAILWLLWPFFPNLGPVAWTGGIVAIAAYLLTLKKTPRGVIWSLLQQIADAQRDKFEPIPPE